MHRLKYAQYIERIEAGLKSNHRCFFKFTNLWRNSSGYPSAMFLGDTCAHNAQEIIEDIEDSSTVSLIQLEEETVERGILALDTQKGPGPDGISPLILKKMCWL
jgi:hypothetical protein